MSKQIIISLLFFILITPSLLAQIVSLDERRTKNPAKGLQGDVQVSINYTNDQRSVLAGGTKVNLQLNDSLNTYLLYSDINLSRTNKKNDLNNGSFGFICNHKAPERVISAEGIVQYQYNGQQSLKHRFILGGGPRWKIVEKDGLKLSLVAYTIYFNERYETTVVNKKSMTKLSTMLSFFTKISANTSIKHNVYYEPDYANPSDYRIESQTTFNAKFSQKFSYNMNFKINYTSMVPTGIDNFNYAILNSLSYSF